MFCWWYYFVRIQKFCKNGGDLSFEHKKAGVWASPNESVGTPDQMTVSHHSKSEGCTVHGTHLISPLPHPVFTDTHIHRVGRVLSVSPVVGIGTPSTPSPQASVPPHPLVRGGGHTR